MKNIKNIAHPSRTCCKYSKPLSYYMQKKKDTPALEATTEQNCQITVWTFCLTMALPQKSKDF